MNWIKLAKDVGFEDVCKLNTKHLSVFPEVRDMCSLDRCVAEARAAGFLSK